MKLIAAAYLGIPRVGGGADSFHSKLVYIGTKGNVTILRSVSQNRISQNSTKEDPEL